MILGVVWLYKQEKSVENRPVQGIGENALKNLPFAFQENRGQVDAVVKYLVKNQAQTIFFSQDHIIYALERTVPEENRDAGAPLRTRAEPDKRQTLAIKQRFVGAKTSVEISGEEQLLGVVNYLIGNDPSKWQKNIPTFGHIKYTDIYDGIDLRYSGEAGSLKYDYFIAPGKDVSQIQIAFEGLDSLQIAEDGSLALVSSFGNIGLQAPAAYQMINGERRVVGVRYELRGDLAYGFTMEAYDHDYELVIDP
jgi:large repetitive protein